MSRRERFSGQARHRKGITGRQPYSLGILRPIIVPASAGHIGNDRYHLKSYFMISSVSLCVATLTEDSAPDGKCVGVSAGHQTDERREHIRVPHISDGLYRGAASEHALQDCHVYILL
jgi:hypothetical protein